MSCRIWMFERNTMRPRFIHFIRSKRKYRWIRTRQHSHKYFGVRKRHGGSSKEFSTARCLCVNCQWFLPSSITKMWRRTREMSLPVEACLMGTESYNGSKALCFCSSATVGPSNTKFAASCFIGAKAFYFWSRATVGTGKTKFAARCFEIAWRAECAIGVVHSINFVSQHQSNE